MRFSTFVSLALLAAVPAKAQLTVRPAAKGRLFEVSAASVTVRPAPMAGRGSATGTQSARPTAGPSFGGGLDARGLSRLFDGGGAGTAEPNHAVKVLLRETNDAIFTPTGALAILTNPEIQRPYTPGYDMGYTHGMDLEVSKTTDKGVTYKLHGGTHLYTLPTGGVNAGLGPHAPDYIPIFFTEENTVAVTADNFSGPDGLKWKGGAGVYSLNSSRVDALGATGQQEAFHKFAGDHRYEFVSDGLGVRTAPFLDVALGFSRTLAEAGKHAVKSLFYLEPRIFPTNTAPSLAGASSVRLHGEASAAIRTNKSEIKLIVGADAIAHGEAQFSFLAAPLQAVVDSHKGGVELSPFVTLNYERARWGIESKTCWLAGKLQNAVNYNWDASPYNSLAIYAFIGRGKKTAGQKDLHDP